jgi:large conductance mechanosensitive channel
MFKEFKAFMMKGNVLDLAVAVVIGAAFGGVVSSFVTDVIMPPIGLLLGGVDFSELYLLLKQGTVAAPYASLSLAQEAGAVTLNYGVFFNAVIQFLIIGTAIFLMVRTANRLNPPVPTPAPAPMKECPHCLSSVPAKATRCAQCTSDLAS